MPGDPAEIARREFPKTCGVCGRLYTYLRWNLLPNPQLWPLEWGEVQELRNCPCGTTLTIVLVEEPK